MYCAYASRSNALTASSSSVSASLIFSSAAMTQGYVPRVVPSCPARDAKSAGLDGRLGPRILLISYATLWLWADVLGPPRRDVRGTRGSDPSGDSRQANLGSGLGIGAGRAVRDQPAGDLQASQGARACRPGLAGPRCATTPAQARGQTTR